MVGQWRLQLPSAAVSPEEKGRRYMYKQHAVL